MTKSFVLFTATGPVLILTSYESIHDPQFLNKLACSDFTKFVAFEVPLQVVKARYGRQFDGVCKDPDQSDELRVLDASGERVFLNISFEEIGTPSYYEHDRFMPLDCSLYTNKSPALKT